MSSNASILPVLLSIAVGIVIGVLLCPSIVSGIDRESGFIINANKLDYTTYISFYKRIIRRYGMCGSVTIDVGGPQPSWNGLLRALRAVHRSVIPGIAYSNNLRHEGAAATGAFEVVSHLDGVPWRKVERVLEIHKKVVIDSGTGWQWA